jgi:hypothetical protein
MFRALMPLDADSQRLRMATQPDQSREFLMPSVTIPTGRVSADEVVTLDCLKADMGLGQAALREARRAGLKVRYIGRRGYVLCSDLIEFVRNTAKVEK